MFAVPGNHDHLRFDLPLPQTFERREPVDAGQPDVQQDDVVGLPRDLLQTNLAALDRVDTIPFVAQHGPERRPHARFVVDDQDG